MSRKTILFLSAVCCRACTWQNGELFGMASFHDNAEGREQFTTFLQAHRDPAYLLTDLVEEDFRHETVPHLHGGERAELVRRKLEQYYRNTPFRQAMTLRRSKDGRRDDDMLFSALTNPALVTPWLSIMLAHDIPFAGIYSIPNISAPLVKDISSGCLLLSWEKHAGLRQSYFDANLLHFSRLTPINESGSFVAAAGAEAARTQQYLKNLSLLPSDHSLNVTIICHANDRLKLEAQLIDDSDMHYVYLDIQELGRHIGSKTLYGDSDATPLFMSLLAAKPPRSQYASPEHTRFLKLLLFRRSLLGLSAVMVAGSLLLGAANIMENIALMDESKMLNSQADLLSQQTRQIIQNFSGTPASAADMKTAVILSRSLNNIFPPPQIMLDGLARTLDDFPSIRIDKLSWQINSGEADTASAAPKQSAVPAQVILLGGELAEFGGGYCEDLKRLEHFQQSLAQHGYSVTALTMPLDVSPQGSIAADTCDGSKRSAQFSLRISWRAAT